MGAETIQIAGQDVPLDMESLLLDSEEADFANLEKLTALLILTIHGCTGSTRLTSLGSVKTLMVLSLWGRESFSDLSFLAGMNLDSLHITCCAGVTDLSPLAKMERLECLNLYKCTGITDISPLASVRGLETVFLQGCTGVTAPSPLAGLKECTVFAPDGTRWVPGYNDGIFRQGA
jgi:internalin A